MGSVLIDIHKKEREFKNLTLSDVNVVKYLILFRNKVDSTYNSYVNLDTDKAGDVVEFNQELIVLYASLDELIKECEFKHKQKILLNLLFEGNTIQDICKMKIGYTRSATYELLDRMIERIISVNNKNWKTTMEKMGYL